jgi:hypothetical protein
MLCVDGPMAGKHMDVPYPCSAIYREPRRLTAAEIMSETFLEPWNEFRYHCHRFRILSSIVLVGSLNAAEPPEDAVIEWLLTDAAKEAIAQ